MSESSKWGYKTLKKIKPLLLTINGLMGNKIEKCNPTTAVFPNQNLWRNFNPFLPPYMTKNVIFEL